MSQRWVWASSTVVAGAIALALILRPSPSIQPELAAPSHIPPAMRAVLKTRMARHGEQMRELVARLVVLDHDGAAGVAGAIYDEPTVARPLVPDELNQLLPERFFALQDELKLQTRKVVAAAARKDAGKLAEEFGTLTKTCVLCHSAYLYERQGSRNAGSTTN
jgi:hypothetical protein